MWDCE
jgi:hypothetical protein